jgi:hypothetical protein
MSAGDLRQDSYYGRGMTGQVSVFPGCKRSGPECLRRGHESGRFMSRRTLCGRHFAGRGGGTLCRHRCALHPNEGRCSRVPFTS